VNAKQLILWREKELAKARTLVEEARPTTPLDVIRIYPEFRLQGVYTTSLEPYAPVWLLLPFFDRVIVGIVPHLRTEDQFRSWYGLTVRDMIILANEGRLAIRLLAPNSLEVVPEYLDPFFSEGLPSTARDLAFDEALLGSDKFMALRDRFRLVLADIERSESIDGFLGAAGRAYKTAETAYIQLHALGHQEAAAEFEKLAKTNLDAAFHWLELCRLFLVGPIHYSLGGIHSVASSVPALRPPANRTSLVFPVELGRILIDAFNLLRLKPSHEPMARDYCIHAYPEYERARTALIHLRNAVESGEATTLKTVDELKEMIAGARTSKDRWLRTMRVVAATGVGIATLPLLSLYGLLVGLGFEVLSELPSKPLDVGLEKVASLLRPKWSRPHLTLLLDLDKSAKDHVGDP